MVLLRDTIAGAISAKIPASTPMLYVLERGMLRSTWIPTVTQRAGCDMGSKPVAFVIGTVHRRRRRSTWRVWKLEQSPARYSGEHRASLEIAQ